MKMDEVLTMGGAAQFVVPGTMVSQGVVQPRTIQADSPEQSGEEYEKLKNRQKEQEKIETEVYNEQEIDYIEDPYEDPEELEKKIKKTIFAIDNEIIADLNIGSIEFAKQTLEKLQK